MIRRYTRTKWLLTIALCLLCWTHVNAPNYNTVKSDDKVIYALFENGFTEPVEVMYFLMNDMGLFKLTSNEENKIYINIWEIKKDFERKGYEISNVIVIIHNHWTHAYFSSNDLRVYRVFKDEGFAGKFYLYVWRNKSIYELAEDLR